MSTQQQDEIAYWIALSLIKGLGNIGICQLLEKFGSPKQIFNTNLGQLKQVVNASVAEEISKKKDAKLIQATLDWLKKDHTHIVTLADNHYPKRLLEISNPPVILYAIGNLKWLNHPSIAMVGSRNATSQGEKNAEYFAQDLSEHGLCVVSGMALGIDGASHRGALKHNGATIAIVGTGLDIVYPAKHRDLAHHIAERGLIISEFPLNTPSKAQNFPRRNRIISGLSVGCLVIEANIGSGSLITARLALEQGREVFAIPGSIHSPMTKGCHALIKQGAKLVENTADILDELRNLDELKNIMAKDGVSGLAEKSAKKTKTSLETNTVLDYMGFEAVNFEAILADTGLTTEALSSMLMVLELDGRITALAGGQYQRLV